MDSVQIEHISAQQLKLLIEKMQTQRDLLIDQRCAYIDKLTLLKPRHKNLTQEVKQLQKQKKVIEDYNETLKSQLVKIQHELNVLTKKSRKIKAETLQEANCMRAKAYEIRNSLQSVYKSTGSNKPNILEIDMEQEDLSLSEDFDSFTLEVPEYRPETNTSITVFQATSTS